MTNYLIEIVISSTETLNYTNIHDFVFDF